MATATSTGAVKIIDICSCGKRCSEADIKSAKGVKRISGGNGVYYYWWDCAGVNSIRETCRSGRCAIEQDGEMLTQPSVTFRVEERNRQALLSSRSSGAEAKAHFQAGREALKMATAEIMERCQNAKNRAGETEACTLEMIGGKTW